MSLRGLFLLLLLFPILPSLSTGGRLSHRTNTHRHRHRQTSRHHHPNSNYVNEACSVTSYKDICLRSLAPFSVVAGRNPRTWARAGVSVTVSEVKGVVKFLVKIKYGRRRGGGGGGGIKGRWSGGDALDTCVETLQDALDRLHQSLHVMRRLSRGEFENQKSDVLTWLSAALTDEDTCTDGFEGVKGRVVDTLRRKVKRASYFTSNALALVNKLATTGLDDDELDGE